MVEGWSTRRCSRGQLRPRTTPSRPSGCRGRAGGVADAVEPFQVGEAAAPHLEAHQLRDHVAVRVVVARARGALVVDLLARRDELQGPRKALHAGVHRLAVRGVNALHRVADLRAGHLRRIGEMVLLHGEYRGEHERGGGVIMIVSPSTLHRGKARLLCLLSYQSGPVRMEVPLPFHLPAIEHAFRLRRN